MCPVAHSEEAGVVGVKVPAHLQAAERQPPLCGWPGGCSQSAGVVGGLPSYPRVRREFERGYDYKVKTYVCSSLLFYLAPSSLLDYGAKGCTPAKLHLPSKTKATLNFARVNAT